MKLKYTKSEAFKLAKTGNAGGIIRNFENYLGTLPAVADKSSYLDNLQLLKDADEVVKHARAGKPVDQSNENKVYFYKKIKGGGK